MTSKERPGEWLRRMAAQSGYDQASLARAVGVSRTAVTNWENGINVPGARNVPALSRAINRPQAEIIERFGVKMSGPLPEPELGDPGLPAALTRLAEIQKGQTEALGAMTELLQALRETVEDLRDVQAGQTRAIERLLDELPARLVRALSPATQLGPDETPPLASSEPATRRDPSASPAGQ